MRVLCSAKPFNTFLCIVFHCAHTKGLCNTFMLIIVRSKVMRLMCITVRT